MQPAPVNAGAGILGLDEQAASGWVAAASGGREDHSACLGWSPCRYSAARLAWEAAVKIARRSAFNTQEAICPCHKGLLSSRRIAHNRTPGVTLVGRLGPPTPGM